MFNVNRVARAGLVTLLACYSLEMKGVEGTNDWRRQVSRKEKGQFLRTAHISVYLVGSDRC